jgi:hypothetical protein
MAGTVHHQVGTITADDIAHRVDTTFSAMMQLDIDDGLCPEFTHEFGARMLGRTRCNHPASTHLLCAAITSMPIGPVPWITTVTSFEPAGLDRTVEGTNAARQRLRKRA